VNVDDVVAEKIAAAKRKAENAKRRRAALAANRQRGLALRHAAKLRRLAEDSPSPATAVSVSPTETNHTEENQ
jgi:hypothetical protein